MRYDPAAAVHAASGLRPAFGHALHKREQRLTALRKAKPFCRPVVHLQVDVDGVFAAPRRVHVRIPDALEIRRERTLARGGNQKVATEVKIGADQSEVRIFVSEQRKPQVRGHRLKGGVTGKRQLRLVKQSAVVLRVCFHNVVKHCLRAVAGHARKSSFNF